jgi:hypothetical protein
MPDDPSPNSPPVPIAIPAPIIDYATPVQRLRRPAWLIFVACVGLLIAPISGVICLIEANNAQNYLSRAGLWPPSNSWPIRQPTSPVPKFIAILNVLVIAAEALLALYLLVVCSQLLFEIRGSDKHALRYSVAMLAAALIAIALDYIFDSIDHDARFELATVLADALSMVYPATLFLAMISHKTTKYYQQLPARGIAQTTAAIQITKT